MSFITVTCDYANLMYVLLMYMYKLSSLQIFLVPGGVQEPEGLYHSAAGRQ